MNCKNCKRNPCSLAGKDHEMSFECKRFVGRTNADRIRSMTDEELADWFSIYCCRNKTYDAHCDTFGNCEECWLDWLKEEYADAL